MGIAVASVDLLSEKAALMRESLQKSQTIADNVVTILGSFDHRLSALETAMRPTQAEAKILKGPHEDLENYLEAIDKLRSNIQFFGSKKGFKSSDGIVIHANNLLAKAISKLEDEFKQLLSSYRDARSNVLEESLQKLGVEKLNKDDVQKLQWEILEAKIGNWIHFMRIAVR
uniref:Uncharacterized protein n=1 Tax=Cajanus cajan TaxID=3821 RepID=A0A151T152_CAJCA|nr:hypothetical protein KK1_023203 [Cajanus cajan]